MAKLSSEKVRKVIDNLKNDIVPMAKSNYEKFGHLTPAMFLVLYNEKTLSFKVSIIDCTDYFQSENTKINFLSKLKRFSENLEPIAIFLVTEGWGADQKDSYDKNGNYIPPKENKKRKELVIVTIDTPYYSEALYYDIITYKDKKTLSDNPEVMEGIGGRFSNILKTIRQKKYN
jgi:hypothetical protein